ncbi:protein enabled homolog [Macrobrachium nipponense]|uniref:protein enabled homolog n=1 Tax=Macrobrachium nipponense TaxID=159736 RepID=UPI0030C83D08
MISLKNTLLYCVSVAAVCYTINVGGYGLRTALGLLVGPAVVWTIAGIIYNYLEMRFNIGRFNWKFDALRRENYDLNVANEGLLIQNIVLAEKLLKGDKEPTLEQSDLRRAELHIQELQEENAELRERAVQLENSKDEDQRQLEELTQKLVKMEAHLEEENRSRMILEESYTTKLQSQERRIAEAYEMTHQFNAHIVQLEQDIHLKDQQVVSLRARVHERESVTRKLQEENHKLRDENSTLQKKVLHIPLLFPPHPHHKPKRPPPPPPNPEPIPPNLKPSQTLIPPTLLLLIPPKPS